MLQMKLNDAQKERMLKVGMLSIVLGILVGSFRGL
jgi:hypothetical protein